MNLTALSRIEPLLRGEVAADFLSAFEGASKFYLQALQNAERYPEVAYLHLITAGEILSNAQRYKSEQLLDVETKEVLEQIRSGLRDGRRIANFVEGKLLQVKRRFVETILQAVDADFFQRSEAGEGFAGLKRVTFREAVVAAYDLRSRYVHTGIPFGKWVSLRTGGMNNEVQLGSPVVEDKELGKILAKAPTYIGLERIIRYSLMRFAIANGAYVEPSPTGGEQPSG